MTMFLGVVSIKKSEEQYLFTLCWNISSVRQSFSFIPKASPLKVVGGLKGQMNQPFFLSSFKLTLLSFQHTHCKKIQLQRKDLIKMDQINEI